MSGASEAAEIFPLAGKRIWVTGHLGMVGSAIVRRLGGEGCEILTAGRDDVDLTRQEEVEGWTRENRPDAIIIAAAKVGGILANATYPADFIYENLMIEANLVQAAHNADVHRLLFLGSSCIYPKFASQPMSECALLTGALEPTNEWYAVAKIAGIKLCEAYRRQHGRHYISAMPTNLYGPGDNFDPEASHVVPGLIRKMDDAKRNGSKEVTLWGTGTPKREFLHVDDMADACIFLLAHYDDASHINVGVGEDISIRALAEMVRAVVDFGGELHFDSERPDGTPRKLMDVNRLTALGWRARIGLREGLRQTYDWYRDNHDRARR